MPFIDMGDEFGTTGEVPIAPEGEYDLMVSKFTHNTDNGKNMLVVDMAFEGAEDYQNIRHFMPLPDGQNDSKKDEEKGNKPGTTAKFKMLNIKRFCFLFDIPFNETGFDTDDLMGARARAHVVQSEYTNNSGATVINNKINLPRLPDDLVAGEAA